MDNIVHPLKILKAYIKIERAKTLEYIAYLNSGDNYVYENLLTNQGIVEGLELVLGYIESLEKVM